MVEGEVILLYMEVVMEVVVEVVTEVDIAVTGVRFKLIIKLIYIQNL